MRKIILFMAMAAFLSGCATSGDFIQRTSNELNINVEAFHSANYYQGEYGFNTLKSTLGMRYHPHPIFGNLALSKESILFIIPRRQRYDKVLEIRYEEISDILVPAWGLNRRLVIKTKNQFFTFGDMGKSDTYLYYNLILNKTKDIHSPETR